MYVDSDEVLRMSVSGRDRRSSQYSYINMFMEIIVVVLAIGRIQCSLMTIMTTYKSAPESPEF